MISEETLRALIVDDEAPAREHLTQLLECHCNVKIVGEANSVATAAALCRDLQPNLIFLDVQMPGGDGFSLLWARVLHGFGKHRFRVRSKITLENENSYD